MFSVQPVDDFVLANDLRLHYRRWHISASRPDLPPILLLHGLASSSYIWNLLAPRLAEQGYEVIALDQRGHGESAKPDYGYDFASILADDRAAVQALGQSRPIVVGHSWGAMAALEYAAAPGDEVSAVILVDGALQQFSQRPGWSLEKALVDLAPPRYAGVTRETFLGFFDNSPLAHAWTPEIEASVLHIVDQHADGTVSPRLTFENHLKIIEAMWHQPTLELYARVRCPLQIILAEHEPFNATGRLLAELREQSLEKIRSLQPDMRLVRMANTVHDIPLQRPQRLAGEILAFVSGAVSSKRSETETSCAVTAKDDVGAATEMSSAGAMDDGVERSETEMSCAVTADGNVGTETEASSAVTAKNGVGTETEASSVSTSR